MEQPKDTRTRPVDALNAKELAFCGYRLRGMSQTQAWREAFNRHKDDANSASSLAAKVANKRRVWLHLNERFASAKKTALMSDSKYLDMLMNDRQAAIDATQWTAVMSANRLIGQAIGALSETLNVNDDRMTDEQLIERLGQSDPAVAEAIKRLVGGRETFH